LLTTIDGGAGGFNDLSSVGFDIMTKTDGTNVAFILGSTAFERHLLFTGDPTSTNFVEVGPVGIGPNEYLFDIAAALPGEPLTVPLPPAMLLGAWSGALVLARRRKLRG
jgi:hypothetical protein